MTNNVVNIEYYYDQGSQAYKEKNFELAANLFKKCYETYEEIELPVFNSRIKEIGEDAFKKYNEIVINQISFLTEYLREKVIDKKIIIIGTHLDKIENKKTQEIITELKNEINLGKAKILFGSLISEEKATLLEKDIINILKEGIK